MIIDPPPSTAIELSDVLAVRFKLILALSANLQWYEIATEEQAALAGALTQTAVGVFWRGERDLAAGGMPQHRWFVLVNDQDPDNCFGEVAMCTPGPGLDSHKRLAEPFHVTGFRNANPYDEKFRGVLAEAIEEFTRATGIDVPPNWQGRPIDPVDGVRRRVLP